MSECQCKWIENVDDMSADYLCVTHGCFALGRAFDHDLCEIARLRAQVQAVRDVCEQQVKDRSLYSADRQFHTLDRIDGWNVALDIVEQALDGAK